MCTVFTENQLPDGYIQVGWTATTPREWHRVLYAIKTMIPKDGRAFVKEFKSWTISPEFIGVYEKIKKATENEFGEKAFWSVIDQSIYEEAVLNSFHDNLKNLSRTMRKRAIYAISAAMGLIDVPVKYSYSKRVFGAWDDQNKVWVYEDGRYSGYSPSEFDKKSIASAHKRIYTARKYLSEFIEELDRPSEDRPYQIDEERFLFRKSILEKYNYACFVCGKRPANLKNLHMHRVLPGKMGGQYIEHNVVLLCINCHRRYEGDSWDAINEAKKCKTE